MQTFTLSKAYSIYGSQMGRRNVLPENRNAAGKLRLVRLKWVDGDYDEGGAYWGGGSGDWIYCATGDLDGEEFTTMVFVRAKSRTEAKDLVRAKVPNARFY